MTVYIEILALLMDVEAELRRLQQWDAEPPSAEAMASTEPFCIDTMSFAQWLQFIFIPRMRMLVEAERLPPGRSEIEPLVDAYFRPLGLDIEPLQRHIRALDQLISLALSSE